MGFVCPDDAGQASLGATLTNAAPRQIRNLVRSGKPIVTYTLIGVCVAVWGLQLLLGTDFTYKWLYAPVATATEPWRMLTAAFLHSQTSPLHILFNMYTLWIFGRELEYVLGRGRYLSLYLVSAFGGSVGVLWLGDPATPVLGASGALFGLMAAYFVIIRSLGGNSGQLAGLIAINLASGFFLPGVAWQAHVGGLLTGAAIAWVYSRNRSAASAGRRTTLVLTVIGALVALTIAGVVRLGLGY